MSAHPVRSESLSRTIVWLVLLAALAFAAAIYTAASGSDGYKMFEGLVVLSGLTGLLAVALRADPAWLISMAILLSIFSGEWDHLGIRIPIDRILLGIGVFALLLRNVAQEEKARLRFSPIHVLLVLVSAYAIGSAFWVSTLYRHDAFYQLLDRLGLVPFAMFAVAPLAFRSARQREILLRVLVVTGAYLGGTALFETIKLRSLIFPAYISDPAIGIHFGRARGPFVEAGANGLALYACGVAAVIAFVTWRGRWTRLFALTVVALCGLGELFTLTRQIWIASAVATAIALLAAPRLRRLILPAAVATGLLIATTLAVIPGLAERVHERRAEKLPVWDRLNSDAAAIRMIAAKPVFGFGWARFRQDSRPYFRQADDYPLTGSGGEVHNMFLSNAVELGVVGATLWVLGLLLAVGGAIFIRGPPELRPWRVGLLAIALHWTIVANLQPLLFVFPNILLWTWAGVCLARNYPARARNALAHPARRYRPWIVG